MMTRQEMFDKAVRGLRSQGFERCYSEEHRMCVYDDGKGRHCAWGWIDEATWAHPDAGDLVTLSDEGIGLAPRLGIEDYSWAKRLQVIHDTSKCDNMEQRLRFFAEQSNLTFPEN